MSPAEIRKAIVAAMEDGAVSTAEWVVVAVATLGALGIVYAVPNQPPVPPRA